MNPVNEKELYESEDEYRAQLQNPYRGLSDEEVLQLSCYEELGPIGERPNVWLIREPKTRHIFVKKYLTTYNKSVYDYLLRHPVAHMPRIEVLYESHAVLCRAGTGVIRQGN